MSLIIGSTTIPTNGDYVKVGSTNVTKVNVVSGGNTTTVWEKIVFSSKGFAYTGGIQSFVVPVTGLYKLEVWGAQGGSMTVAGIRLPGGNGGYSIGYKVLTANQTIYICCGGTVADDVHTGGYNGGGTAYESGGGGGATHIGTQNALLQNYSVSNLFIVAGGGGGCGRRVQNEASPYYDYGSTGGSGGGTNGGNGQVFTYGSGLQKNFYGTGGTQSSGGAYYDHDKGLTGIGKGSFGKGGSAPDHGGGGGGGGYYGGGSGANWNGGGPAGGGSGYTGGVPSISRNGSTYSPSMTNGSNSGNGKAKITFVSS